METIPGDILESKLCASWRFGVFKVSKLSVYALKLDDCSVWVIPKAMLDKTFLNKGDQDE